MCHVGHPEEQPQGPQVGDHLQIDCRSGLKDRQTDTAYTAVGCWWRVQLVFSIVFVMLGTWLWLVDKPDRNIKLERGKYRTS